MKTSVKPSEIVKIDALKGHELNYREHHDDQINHLMQSIKQNGFYKNIVVAKDNTILAGHGIIKAAKKLGMTEVSIQKLDIDPQSPQALKILAGDNEVGRLAEIDDRSLSEILKKVKDEDIDGLLGTGYDEMMLANLVMVTRHGKEIANINEAAEWVGMPDYQAKDDVIKITIQFRSEEDREVFSNLSKLKMGKDGGTTWSCWWPPKEKEDISSVKYET
jgi:hypothetical protein